MPSGSEDPNMPAAAVQTWPVNENEQIKINKITTIILIPAYPNFWSKLFGARPTYKVTVWTADT